MEIHLNHLGRRTGKYGTMDVLPKEYEKENKKWKGSRIYNPNSRQIRVFSEGIYTETRCNQLDING